MKTLANSWGNLRWLCLCLAALLVLGNASAWAAESKDEAKPETEAEAKPDPQNDKAEPEAKDAEKKETKLTPEQLFEGGEKTYNNWVELSVGGFFPQGNRSRASERHRASEGLFGGIEDLHFQGDVAKKMISFLTALLKSSSEKSLPVTLSSQSMPASIWLET